MPLQRCTLRGQSGWKWGNQGTCYTGPGAKQKAINQALAIGEGKFPEDKIKFDTGEIMYDDDQQKCDFRMMMKQALKQLTLSQRKRISKKKIPSIKDPILIEKGYAKDIKEVMRRFTTITNETVINKIPNWVQEQESIIGDSDLKKDGIVEDLRQLNGEYAREQEQIFNDGRGVLWASIAATGFTIAEWNQKQVQNIFKKIFGTEINLIEPWEQPLIRGWTARNVNLIKGLTDDYIKKINDAIISSIQGGETQQALVKRLGQINQQFTIGTKEVKTVKGKKVSRRKQSRAELIARDQTNKLNGMLSRRRQVNADIQMYIWRTARDERVRSNHKVMDGKLCRWDNPTVYSKDGGKTWISRRNIGGVMLHPGQDIQCRCSGDPVFSGIIGELLEEIEEEERMAA